MRVITTWILAIVLATTFTCSSAHGRKHAFRSKPSETAKPIIDVDAENRAMGEAIRIDPARYNALPFNQAIKLVYGKGQRRLAVFTNPLSSSDHQFFDMLSNNASKVNATIYVFPYAPKQADQSAAADVISRLLCSANPADTWRQWIKLASVDESPAAQASGLEKWKSSLGPVGACQPQSRMASIQRVAFKQPLSDTPAIMFEDGALWPGTIISLDDLEGTWAYVATLTPDKPK
jgi:thiol:disulfide interchange protein DsbC